MLLQVLKSKIHRVTVTEANLDYIGSITIDSSLMEAAGIIPGERVFIVDNNNGERFDTYAIPGEAGSGVICLNGAAARRVHRGDVVIIMAYALVTPDGRRVDETAAGLSRHRHQPAALLSANPHSKKKNTELERPAIQPGSLQFV